jgi:hypothetical protein
VAGIRNGEGEDAPSQFGEGRPEDGLNEGRMGERLSPRMVV